MSTGVIPRARVLALAALGLMALAGCRRAPAPPDPAPVPQPATVADIQAMTKDPSARAVLVNVWASWCMPCREELPALVQLQHELEGQGLKLVLVSADFDVPMEKLTEFLSSQGVDFPTYIKVERDQEFMKAMSDDWGGAIPATFLYTNDGELYDFWEGKATHEVFAAKVREAMAASPAPVAGGSAAPAASGGATP